MKAKVKMRQALGGLVVWSERRYAKRASREVLQLYWSVHREHPELASRSLYEAVVMRRFSPRSVDAVTIVRRAEESFTTWPRKRPLRFQDVVHYLIFDEYMRLHRTRGGMCANLDEVVSRIIPEDL